MNLFELIATITILAGLVIGFVHAFGGGISTALVGALRGAGYAFGAYTMWLLSICALLALALGYRPSFPRCKTGKCTARRYRYLSLDSAKDSARAALPEGASGMLARCECGTLYLRSTSERRVWEVTDDGRLVPHMRYRPFGRWRADSGTRT
jgi:hypothetical protein